MPLSDRSTTVLITATAALGAIGVVLWHQQRRKRHPLKEPKESSRGGTREAPDDAPIQKNTSAKKSTSSRDAQARATSSRDVNARAVAAAANRAAASAKASEAAKRPATTQAKAKEAAPRTQLSAHAPEFVPGSAWVMPSSPPSNMMPVKVVPQSMGRRPLRERLSIMLTTSPVGRHPSTDLIDEVLASMRMAGGITECDLVIVCDGYKEINGDGVRYTEPKYRSGIVDADSAAKYEAYKKILRTRQRPATPRSPGVQIIELNERQGFGFAVKAALDYIRTPYVLVMQHDRNFMKACDVPRLVDAMEQNTKVKYIGLPTNTTYQHAYHVLSKYSIRIEPIEGDKRGLELVPLIQWYDSAHICETDYYRQFVFGPRRLVVRGGFIEDKFGQAQLADIRARGVEAAHPEYGTFIASGDGFSEPCIGHLDGRDSLNTVKFKHTISEENSASNTVGDKDIDNALGQIGGVKADVSDANVELYSPPIRAKSLFDLGDGRREWRSCDVLACNHSKQQYRIRWNGRQDVPEVWVSALQLILETPDGEHNAEPEPEHSAPPAIPDRAQPQPFTMQNAPPCPKHGWQYIDPKQTVQGPFSLIEMQHWNSKGYFTPDLPMRCDPSDQFVPFRELFPVPAIPFQSPPKRAAQFSARK